MFSERPVTRKGVLAFLLFRPQNPDRKIQKGPVTRVRELALSNLNPTDRYALNELPQPQVDFTFGLLNLNPEPSMLST